MFQMIGKKGNCEISSHSAKEKAAEKGAEKSSICVDEQRHDCIQTRQFSQLLGIKPQKS